MKKNLLSAAIDIVFSTVVYLFFYHKLEGWALQLFWTDSPIVPIWIVSLVIQAAAFVIYILYIKFLTEGRLSDYYLAGIPKLRFFWIGILSAVFYAAIVLLLFPGKWTVHIGEPALHSVASAVFKSIKRYIKNAEYFSVVLFGGMCFGALMRRKVKLSMALLIVGILAMALSYDGIDSVASVTHLLFSGIQIAAFCMVARYTGSVWSAVLLDLPFSFLMNYYIFRFFHGFHVPHPDDINILFSHQADNTNELLNCLFFGYGGSSHAHSVPMALFYLLLIICLYTKLRKKEAEQEQAVLPGGAKKLSDSEIPKREADRNPAVLLGGSEDLPEAEANKTEAEMEQPVIPAGAEALYEAEIPKKKTEIEMAQEA